MADNIQAFLAKESNFMALINHIFLPKKLPSGEDEAIIAHEFGLLLLMRDTVLNFEDIITSNTRKWIETTFEIESESPLNVQRISSAINELQPGEMFTLYIRWQNCGLSVFVPNDGTSPPENVIVSTFEPSLKNEIVYSNLSDIQNTFPHQSIKLKHKDIIKSEAFAEQLADLHVTMMDNAMPKTQKANQTLTEIRDVPCDMYVSEWIAASVGDHDAQVATIEEFPVISKKIRDEVQWSNAKLPFRRSGMWTAIKVFLQLNLTVEHDNVNGIFLYKLIMLKVLSRMCDCLLDRRRQIINLDLSIQMLAKTARRIEKLSSLIQNTEVSSNLKAKFYEIREQTKDSIASVRRKMDQQFNEIIQYDQRSQQLMPLSDLNFEQDVLQKVPKLRNYLIARKNFVEEMNANSVPNPAIISRHYSSLKSFPTMTAISNTSSEQIKNIYLTDTEQWIRTNLDRRTFEDVTAIRQLFFDYSGAAEPFYANDPVGGSKMILVLTKMIYVLDKIAVEKYSMLRQHHSCVNPRVLEMLDLPQRGDMELAADLQLYFENRNKLSTDPGLLSEEELSPQSFSSKYAGQNKQMIEVKTEILKEAERKIQEKKQELNNAREKLRQMRDRASRMSCDYYYSTNKYYIRERYHSSSCSLCNLNREIANYGVSIYERPLKNEEFKRNGAVFELLIPNEIACLRDCLFKFIQNVCTSHLETPERNQVIGNWTDYHKISIYATKRQQKVFLGSTTKLMEKSHYGDFQHPDLSDDRFILNNGYNCHFTTGSVVWKTHNINNYSVKQFCTLQVEANSSYRNLQWTLENTSHTQNAILAAQSDCDLKLQLNEFISFGSLRSDGWRLQLRNILRCITSESLSFEQPSVVSLVLQALWETGPNGISDWNRDAHQDYADVSFAGENIRVLEQFLITQENNWKHPPKLLLIIFITVRIIELNSDEGVIENAVKFLIKCRKIAVTWMERIKTAKAECNKLADIEELRTNLVDVAICGALTFFISKKQSCFNDVVANNGSVYSWLLFIVTIANNMLLSEFSVASIPPNKKMFLRMIRNIGITIEDSVKDVINKDNTFVNEFVKTQWADSRDAVFHQWAQCANVPQIIYAKVLTEKIINYVQIDVIFGEFLVNGLPVSRLPSDITNDPVFQRLFGALIFEVQPSGKTFSTINKYNDCSYIFEKCDSRLIIRESGENGMFELIPHTVLEEETYFLLIAEQSHWWKLNKYSEDIVIQFRPKRFAFFNFLSAISYELNFFADECFLLETRTKRRMLDVLSNSFEQLITFLARFEDSKYIHILMDEKLKASIELPRMRIKFKVDCKTMATSYDLMSHEHDGMRVSLEQKFGTLVGLQNGLLLESLPNLKNENESNESKKILLMPHGTIDAQSNVQIINESLRQPPFFIYDVDERCKQLRAHKNFSAWFYLAYLHAITAHPLPDPFTGMTGTERALQILQSGLAWSSEPYDLETVTTLKNILQLTPRRTFYPANLRNMQQIVWPDYITSLSAHDGYKQIVEKLISDSERLKDLHFSKKSTQLEDKTVDFLNRRAYLRHHHSNPNAKITDTFFNYQNCYDLKKFVKNSSNRNLTNMRKLAALDHKNLFHCPDNSLALLKGFLMTRTSLDGMMYRNLRKVFENVSFEGSNLHNIWIDLYNAIRKKSLPKEKLMLLLELSTFEGCEFDQIRVIHTILQNCDRFENIAPPDYTSYKNTNESQYNSYKVQMDIRSNQIGQSEYISRYQYQIDRADDGDKTRVYNRLATEYSNQVDAAVSRFECIVQQQWPKEGCTILNSYSSEVIEMHKASKQIDFQFHMWYQNRSLLQFLEKVSMELDQIQMNGHDVLDLPNWTRAQLETRQMLKFNINFKRKQCSDLTFHNALIHEARIIYNKQKYDTNEIKSKLEKWWKVFLKASVPTSNQHLLDSGLFPRLVPSLIFPQILTSTNEDQKTFIGALAVLTTLDQRQLRIKTMKSMPHMEVIYRRELETIPHENWKPSEYPEWLLFEIEMNLSIRRIQIEVAKRMIEPPDREHSVMQLNMGEGKTAVIVPILATILSNEKQVCQITVLKSLFKTNLKSLRQCLGGMLNRRVYTFPCRRDMQIEEHARRVLSIYQECKQKNGVIVTLPEYRLSFQLKLYETILKGDITNGQIFLETHKWLNKNVRNILDESDAILHAKYQLIYTCGEQLLPDGGALRWTIAQALFKLIPSKLGNLWKIHGNEKIEFNSHCVINGETYYSSDSRPEVFWPCRILDCSIYKVLINEIADDFIKGETAVRFPVLRDSEKVVLKKLILDTDINVHDFETYLNNFEDEQKDTIFILAGLLKYEIFRLVLSKRWRVNYGVNPKGPRKMAVPFKAKDVAAEMTEFGHPDVAICYTHLSYYYSGLSDEQLFETLDVLSRLGNPEDTYNDWLKYVPEENKQSISAYSGINLSDPNQREQLLFPVLRFNMYVIDFWLSNCVFPRESKLFARKMMCTAWDLCSESFECVVTGFSGTNDTKLLLPLPIHQKDLEELEKTNENMRETLLRKENNYMNLTPNVSALDILKMLRNEKIPVLLDSGALMLELNNHQVAKEWLGLVSPGQFEGAVYFNKDDVLMAIDRNGNECEFELSVFRERLDRCVVYLDDTHTRGTDLKFPKGARACVTLSGEITRDKTVQACMRMRMLGQGHTVSFWASEEADNKLRQICKKEKHEVITTSEVVKFISSNSDDFQKDGLVHWCAAGCNYAKNILAHKAFGNDDNSITQLSEHCLDNEILKLSELFGAKENVLLTSIANAYFKRLEETYTNYESLLPWTEEVKIAIHDILKSIIPDTKRYTQLLDEEQEKELEHELEEQREISRPGKANPAKPATTERLKVLFTHGLNHITETTFNELKADRQICQLPYGLEKTTIWDIAQKDAWGEKIFVTKDFNAVIKAARTEDKEDEFLRPVWWIVSINTTEEYYTGSPVLLLLSPYECNHFMPVFRFSNANSTLHMYSARTQMDQNSLLNNIYLQMPILRQVKHIDHRYLSELTLFAGSVYFESKDEQDAYTSFLGLIPRPRSSEHEEAFENQLITSNGFVPPQHRHIFPELSIWCKFVRNPDKLVTRLAETRIGFLSNNSHVSLLVNESKIPKCFMEQNPIEDPESLQDNNQ